MLYEYDTYIECKQEEFLLFYHYLKSILLPYETHMLSSSILQKGYTPKSFILLSKNDPFFEENNQNNQNNNIIYEQFFITNDLSYTMKNNNCYIYFNTILYKRYIDENDIFITWLLHLSRKFNNLHIKNYQSMFDFNFDYYENILYTYFYNQEIIDIYDIHIETYYLKKHGIHILNNGFYILYPMYKDILHFNHYESYFFYKLLHHFKFSNLIDKPFLLNKRYLQILIKFNDLLQKHKYISHLIIDQTIYLIKNYNEIGLIKFQSFIKYKLKLRKVLTELNEFNYLPPFTEYEFNDLFENKYYKIYRLGGPLFREKKNNFYQK